MRFPSRGGRVLLLLLGITLGPFLLVLPATVWLLWTLTPLQKFYLGTYVASSLGATQPHSTTGLQWVLKTAPGRNPSPCFSRMRSPERAENCQSASRLRPLRRAGGSGVGSPGAEFFFRAGPVFARGGIRRQECAVASGDAPDLSLGSQCGVNL